MGTFETIDFGASMEKFSQLGIRITAEGIETMEQYRTMAEKGCDLAQGYLLGQPEPLSTRHSHLATA